MKITLFANQEHTTNGAICFRVLRYGYSFNNEHTKTDGLVVGRTERDNILQLTDKMDTINTVGIEVDVGYITIDVTDSPIYKKNFKLALKAVTNFFPLIKERNIGVTFAPRSEACTSPSGRKVVRVKIDNIIGLHIDYVINFYRCIRRCMYILCDTGFRFIKQHIGWSSIGEKRVQVLVVSLLTSTAFHSDLEDNGWGDPCYSDDMIFHPEKISEKELTRLIRGECEGTQGVIRVDGNKAYLPKYKSLSSMIYEMLEGEEVTSAIGSSCFCTNKMEERRSNSVSYNLEDKSLKSVIKYLRSIIKKGESNGTK